MPVVRADVVDAPLDVETHLKTVDDPRQGAIASFVGRVRNHDREVAGVVSHLSYSAHPDAPQVIRQIAERVVARHDPHAEALVAVTHRVGELQVGDIAVVAAVSAPHRALAFELCEALIEEIKRSLPIWKKQFDTGGSSVWSGLS